MHVVGIDLAGSEKRVTGFCRMSQGLRCETEPLYSNKEIIEKTLGSEPSIISIDAPLCLPKGRKSLKDRNAPHLRECDKALQRMHIRFFPITLGPMRMLTARGILLKRVFEKKGFEVIESFPGAAQDVLHIPRKQKGIEKLKKGLMKFGVTGGVERKDITHDELDGITCAIVGKMYLENNYTALGVKEEGFLIIPRSSK